MTNEQKAARLERQAVWKEDIAHFAAQDHGNGKERSAELLIDAALLREAAAMMRERKTVERDAEGGSTKNGLHLFTGPVLSGFISLVTKKGQMLYMDWHPTLEDARAAAVAWVDEQEGRDV